MTLSLAKRTDIRIYNRYNRGLGAPVFSTRSSLLTKDTSSSLTIATSSVLSLCFAWLACTGVSCVTLVEVLETKMKCSKTVLTYYELPTCNFHLWGWIINNSFWKRIGNFLIQVTLQLIKADVVITSGDWKDKNLQIMLKITPSTGHKNLEKAVLSCC